MAHKFKNGMMGFDPNVVNTDRQWMRRVQQEEFNLIDPLNGPKEDLSKQYRTAQFQKKIFYPMHQRAGNHLLPSAATDANAAMYERRNNCPEETKSMVSRVSKSTSKAPRNRDNMSMVSVLTPRSSVQGGREGGNRFVDNGTSCGSVTYVTATTRNTAISTKAQLK